MSLWRQITRGLRVLVDRRRADDELAEELQHYLDHAAAELTAAGASPADAQRIARARAGNFSVARDEVRSAGWEGIVEAVSTDVRYAARRVRHHPGFTVVAGLTLALGIGASTAIFSAVDPILFRPLPYPHAERIVAIADVGRDGTPLDVTFGSYRELAARSRSFDAIAVHKRWQPTLTGGTEPERVEGERASADYFRVLGVLPTLGRSFIAADDRVHGPKVVILGDALWRRRFAGDPSIVGREVRIDDDAYTVVGVMPRGFENVAAPSAQLWAPLQYDPALPFDGREWGHHLRMIARLRPGVGIASATRELDAIARHRVADFDRPSWAGLDNGLIVHSLQDDVTRAVKPALLAVLGAVLLVLVVACVNVTNLLIARGAQRRGELAVRAALGAGRARLVRQLLAESLLLALIGGALGATLAQFGIRALVALSPVDLPRIGAVRLDATALAFAVVVTTVVGLLVGAAPALHATRADLQAGLQQTSRRAVGGHRRTRGALVVAEVALALVLLVSAGLLLRSLERLFAVDLGFDPSRVLTMQVVEVGRRFDSDAARYRFFMNVLDDVRQIPGVTAAALTSQLPLSGDRDGYGAHFEADQDVRNAEGVLRYAVTPDYFAVMHIPLLRGRLLTEHDDAGAPRAVLINASLAARKFPGRDPIGQRLTVGPDDGQWYTVVGVVGNVRQASLAADGEDAVYVAPAQWHWVDNVMSLVIRSRADPAALAAAVRRAIWSLDKDEPIVRVATMDDLMARSEANRHFVLTLLEAFGLSALALAAIGIYGVVSGSVAERLRELGVRAALGAAPRDLLRLIVRDGLTLTAGGVVLGVGGAAVASRAIATMLFGVSRLDPVTYGGVVVLLLGVSVLACWVPARRAARVDPSVTLRAE